MEDEKVQIDMDLENLEFARKMSSEGVKYLNRIGDDIFGIANVTKKQVKNLMKDPVTNAVQLQKIYNIIRNTSGTLKEIVMYKTEIPTYDHYILPLDMGKYKDLEKLEKAEFKAATQIEKYKLKYNIPWMTQRIVEQGVLYNYKVETPNEIFFIEIPSDKCVITSFKDGIWRFGINVRKFNAKSILSYPEEIQQVYEDYKNGLIKKDDLIDNTYYELSENAFAFSLDRFTDTGIPYYSHLLCDLLTLAELKDLESESAKLDNYKLIHQTPLTDKDTGKMQHDANTNTMYHNALKKQVPDGVGVITSPLKIESVPLGNSKESKMKYNNQLEESIYSSAGVNSELMNGSKSSNEAIALGSVIDTLLAFKILRIIANWLNLDLKKNSITKNWKVEFVKSTNYNQQQMITNARSNITTWMSKRVYMALMGHTPLDAINIIKYEDMLGLNTLLQPLMTSHTMTSEDVGRPSNAESGDTLTTTGEAE